MKIIIYQEKYETTDSLNNFLDQLYRSQMNHLASDLLQVGLTPGEIITAVDRAILVLNTVGLQVSQHFAPVYTQSDNYVLKDCKLSRLGYNLVLLNANVNIRAVAERQIQLLKHILGGF